MNLYIVDYKPNGECVWIPLDELNNYIDRDNYPDKVSGKRGKMDREGYYQHTQKSCGLCKWHKQTMIHSGRNPLYHHFCNHPKGRDSLGENFIGEDSYTPDWCPVGALKEGE